VTFEQLERSLPNGLHDAELVGLQVDYAAREAVLTVNVDIGGSDDDASQSSQNYRAARIRFFEIQFVVIDPPTYRRFLLRSVDDRYRIRRTANITLQSAADP